MAVLLSCACATRRARRIGTGFVAGSVASAAAAHGFGQRFDLPLPLWLWLIGAGGTIVATFLLMAVFLKETKSTVEYPRLDLLRYRAVRGLASATTVAIMRVASVLFFALTVCAGLIRQRRSLLEPYTDDGLGHMVGWCRILLRADR